jgi:hypothetical protein
MTSLNSVIILPFTMSQSEKNVPRIPGTLFRSCTGSLHIFSRNSELLNLDMAPALLEFVLEPLRVPKGN